MHGRPPTRATVAVNHLQCSEHLGTTRADHRQIQAERNRAHLGRKHFARHPTAYNPGIDERSRRDAVEDVRDDHGIEEVLAQGPAKGQAECQQRGGANA